MANTEYQLLCKNCGTQMAESEAFCPMCGTKREISQPAIVEAPAFNVDQAPENFNMGFRDPSEIAPYTAVGKKKGLAGLIFGMLFTVLLIIGGLSGVLVLRGTDSSDALVWVCVIVFIPWDIFSFVRFFKSANPTIYTSNDYVLVFTYKLTKAAKANAKSQKMNINDYCASAIGASVPAQLVEGLGVAVCLNPSQIAYVSKKPEYLDHTVSPMINLAMLRNQYGLDIEISAVHQYNEKLVRVGEIKNSVLEGKSIFTKGLNIGFSS